MLTFAEIDMTASAIIAMIVMILFVVNFIFIIPYYIYNLRPTPHTYSNGKKQFKKFLKIFFFALSLRYWHFMCASLNEKTAFRTETAVKNKEVHSKRIERLELGHIIQNYE